MIVQITDGQRHEAEKLIKEYAGKKKDLTRLKETVKQGQSLAAHQVRMVLRHYKKL